MLDTRRVVHVSEYLMTERLLYSAASFLEQFELTGREAVEIITVASHEMREHRSWYHRLLVSKSFNQLINLILLTLLRTDIESQSVHTRIQFDMYRPSGNTLLTCCLDQRIQQSEGIHLRFQVIIEHRLESGHLRIHHHDATGDARFPQGYTLISHSHSQIIHMMILQCLGNLHRSGSIAISLDHAHHLRLRLQERAKIVQVVNKRVQVHLENGLVHLLLQQFSNLLEAESAPSLQENHLIVQVAEQGR